MALFKPVEANFGGNIQASYHRVEHPAIIGKAQMSFSLVSFFMDPKDSGIEPMIKAVFTCAYDMESAENPFQQAYQHIKGLPEWPDAVDC
jgi:hypothetical protein